MSRVERTEPATERRRTPQPWHALGRRRDDPNRGHAPAKAEGEEQDVEEALQHQSE